MLTKNMIIYIYAYLYVRVCVYIIKSLNQIRYVYIINTIIYYYIIKKI